MSHKALTIPSVVAERVVRGRVATDLLLIAGASLLIAIAAQVNVMIPFTPVPLTLQPLAVLLIGVTRGATRGSAAAALYLLEGISGMPVFTNGGAGLIWLAGPTGGYLLSYPLAAGAAGFISERGWGSNVVRATAGMLAALAIIFAGGWSWLALQVGAQQAWNLGVAPFVLADMVKVAIGAALLPTAQKFITR
jgi:biotin transport system substrate-specific component